MVLVEGRFDLSDKLPELLGVVRFGAERVVDTSGEALGDYPTLTIRESSAGPEPQVVDQLLEFVRNPPIVAPEYAERVRESFSAGRIAGMYESVIQDFREVSRRHDSDGTVR